MTTREIVVVVWLTDEEHDKRVSIGINHLLERLKENDFVKDFEITREDIESERDSSR